MTRAGWVFMLGTWLVILTMFVWALVRTFRTRG